MKKLSVVVVFLWGMVWTSSSVAQWRPQLTVPVDGEAPGRIVIKFNDDRNIEPQSGRVTGDLDAGFEQLLDRYHVRIARRLMTQPPEKFRQAIVKLSAQTKSELPDLSQYFVLENFAWDRAESLLVNLNNRPEVDVAYYEPPAEPSYAAGYDATPDYDSLQTYLDAAPGGIDARAAWLVTGGTGDNVRIVHIEGDWRTTHEDLNAASHRVWTPTVMNSLTWRNHGTAVLGALVGTDNEFGIKGIAYEADVGLISIDQLSVAEAIFIAADSLNPGDVIVITLQRPGPRYNFQPRADQLGYIAVEYSPAEFDAIQIAVASGIIVCEAAGNGHEDLDDAIYEGAFDPSVRHSGAILCGAGAPPSGSFGPDRNRIDFSNYGARLDLQGYGAEVVTTGYGILHAGAGEDEYYTNAFSGTSSATPIVAGAVVAVEGVYRAMHGIPMPVAQVRDLLSATGSVQTGNTTENIGPRPDLAAALAALPSPGPVEVRPSMLAANLIEGEESERTLYLVNRSDVSTWSFDVAINDGFTFAAGIGHITVVPNSGQILPDDSVALDVTLTTSGLIPLTGYDRSHLAITGSWSADTLSVPIFVAALCAEDTTYSIVTSDSVGMVQYKWLDVAAIGSIIPPGSFYNTEQPSLALDDGTAGPFALTMPFEFYDSSYSSVYVGVNGAISFSDPEVNADGFFDFLSIPQSEISAFVPVFWNDLVIDPVSGHGAIHTYQSATGDTFAVEWNQIGNFNDPNDTLVTFELILLNGRRLIMNYQSVGTGTLGETALVGTDLGDCRHDVFPANPDSTALADSFAVVVHRGDDPLFLNGDFNGDGLINLLDVVRLIDYVYRGGPAPDPLGRGETDCLPGINLLDIVKLIDFLFRNGPYPCVG